LKVAVADIGGRRDPPFPAKISLDKLLANRYLVSKVVHQNLKSAFNFADKEGYGVAKLQYADCFVSRWKIIHLTSSLPPSRLQSAISWPEPSYRKYSCNAT